MILIACLTVIAAVDYNGIVPDNIIVSSELQIIVYSRDGCSACKKMEPIVKGLKEDGYNISISKEFDGPVPTIVVLDSRGKELRRHTGYLSKAELIEFISKS